MGEQQINTYYISIQNVFTTHLSFSPLFVVFPPFRVLVAVLYIWWPKKRKKKCLLCAVRETKSIFPSLVICHRGFAVCLVPLFGDITLRVLLSDADARVSSIVLIPFTTLIIRLVVPSHPC